MLENDSLDSSNNMSYAISGAIIDTFLGLNIAYFTEDVSLTPVDIAIAVFSAVAITGALIGYGIAKFSGKVSEERQKDSSISVYTTVRNVLYNGFITKHSERSQMP